MSNIREILKGQKIRIDNHGHYESQRFEDKRFDVHLDKETKTKYYGEKIKVQIRIPVNSDRECTTEIVEGRGEMNRKKKEIFEMVSKEVRNAFSEKEERARFIDSMCQTLCETYPVILEDHAKAQDAARRVLNAFGIDYSKVEIEKELFTINSHFAVFFLDKEDNQKYHYKMNRKEIMVEGFPTEDYISFNHNYYE